MRKIVYFSSPDLIDYYCDHNAGIAVAVDTNNGKAPYALEINEYFDPIVEFRTEFFVSENKYWEFIEIAGKLGDSRNGFGDRMKKLINTF